MDILKRLIPGLLLCAVLGSAYIAQNSGIDILGKVSAWWDPPAATAPVSLPPKADVAAATTDDLDEAAAGITKTIAGLIVAASMQAQQNSVYSAQLYIAGTEQLRKDIDARIASLEQRLDALKPRAKPKGKAKALKAPQKPASPPKGPKAVTDASWPYTVTHARAEAPAPPLSALLFGRAG